jgi:hypothetical protein
MINNGALKGPLFSHILFTNPMGPDQVLSLVLDNVQNSDSRINIPSSLTYRDYYIPNLYKSTFTKLFSLNNMSSSINHNWITELIVK